MPGEQNITHSNKWLFSGIRVIILLNLCLTITYVGFWFIAFNQDLLWRADFTAYYTGGALVRDGLGTQLYDLDLQARYQQEILQGRSFKDGLLPFNSPPHLALIISPLTYLPLSMAFWIWTLAEIGLIIWAVFLLLQLMSDWEPYERWIWLSILLAFPPLMRTLLQGTFSLLTLVCALQIYSALKTDTPWQAGIWLAVGGLLRPHVLFPIGLFLLCQRRCRILLWVSLLVIGIVGITAIFLGWQTWLGFYEVVLKSSEFFDSFGVYPETMYNLKGTLSLWWGDSYALAINRISFIGFLLYVLVMCWIWFPSLNFKQPVFELRLALGLVLGLFFGLHVNPHDGLMLILPMFLFYIYLKASPMSLHRFLIFAAVCPILLFLSEFVVGGMLGIRIPVLIMIVSSLWMGKMIWDPSLSSPRRNDAF